MSENVEKKSENSENSTDTEEKTCGFCKVFCGNEHCITKEKK